jgi:hypothetical protein
MLSVREVDAKLAASGFDIERRMMVKSALKDAGLLLAGMRLEHDRRRRR